MEWFRFVAVLALLGIAAAELYYKVGMEDGRITDTQITASTCYDQNHCTDRARLNQPAGGGKTGAWSTRYNYDEQHIQADLRALHKVGGVITQGRNAYSQWVTSFKVSYSLDGLTWTYAKNAYDAGSEVFDGNTDQDTLVTSEFDVPVVARYIRFEPVTWHNHISMRFEILGKVLEKVEGPEVPLGMESGAIPDNVLTASTSYDVNHGPERARLDIAAAGGKIGAWSALTNDVNQWIQVDLSGFYIVEGLITQGRQDADQWVTNYKVAHSDDGSTFTFIQDCAGDDLVFGGNSDRDTKVTRRFAKPVVARFMRIHPTTWNNHISLRFEVLGRGKVAGHRFEGLKLGMEDGRIADSQLSASSIYNSAHSTANARLNHVAGNGRTGAWSALTNDHSQWFQVDMGVNYELRGIITQGRSDADQWVTSFTMQSKVDGGWSLADIRDGYVNARVFTGNTDRNSLVVNHLNMPRVGRIFRILPQTWSGYISMRFELLGEGPINVVPTPSRLGIEDGRVAESSMSASSCWNYGHCVWRSRLNQPEVSFNIRGAWSALVNDENQWIQVDLRSAFEVTGIITQGRHELSGSFNQWVTSYTVSYSIDGKDWAYVASCESNEPHVFAANSDRTSLVTNPINPSVTARFFRVNPVTWNNHISMRWELIGTGPHTMTGTGERLGVEDYRIPDSAMSASTIFDANHAAHRGRLNIAASGDLKGAWSALTLDHSQWLQISLGETHRVAGIVTQGRADADQWVTSFKVAHSWDGHDWTTILAPGSQQEKEFNGNDDRTQFVFNPFAPAITTRFVRILPDSWHGHISMRVELLGAVVANILYDPVPLGLESYVVPDSSMTSSSQWDADHGPKRGRLNLQRVGDLRGAWSAQTNDANQWIQVDLSSPHRIIGVTTQGRADLGQWVTAYKVSCSLDGDTFDTVQGICTNAGQDRIFTANSDQNTKVYNELPKPHICRYVRVLPTTWNGHVSLRMELHGEGPVAPSP